MTRTVSFLTPVKKAHVQDASIRGPYDAQRYKSAQTKGEENAPASNI